MGNTFPLARQVNKMARLVKVFYSDVKQQPAQRRSWKDISGSSLNGWKRPSLPRILTYGGRRLLKASRGAKMKNPSEAEQLAALWSRGEFQMTALMDDPVMQSSPSPLPCSADGPHFPFRPPRLRAP